MNENLKRFFSFDLIIFQSYFFLCNPINFEMKLLFIFIFCIIQSTENKNIALLRNLYFQAAKNEASAIQLIAVTKNEESNSVIKAYNGVGKILMAKYYANPYSKLKTFNEGKEILESAIKTDALNPELRFLRLSIQKNIPSFLGYHKNIAQDKSYLIQQLASIKDEQLKSIISNYLKSI